MGSTNYIPRYISREAFSGSDSSRTYLGTTQIGFIKAAYSAPSTAVTWVGMGYKYIASRYPTTYTWPQTYTSPDPGDGGGAGNF